MLDTETFSRDLITFRSDGSGPSISITLAALRNMERLALDCEDTETGGILVGRNAGRNVEVTDVSDAGPNAQQSSVHFVRDTEHCRKFLERCYRETGADYVGEWHTHVVRLRHLSAGDIRTLVEILIDPDYAFLSFAVFLVVVEDRKAELHVYIAERAGEEPFFRIEVVRLYKGP